MSATVSPTPFPAVFSLQVGNDNVTINFRVGGGGPAVVLIHGFANTGDKWSSMAAELVPRVLNPATCRRLARASPASPSHPCHPAGCGIGASAWGEQSVLRPTVTKARPAIRQRLPAIQKATW
jgi:hypothetical protein